MVIPLYLLPKTMFAGLNRRGDPGPAIPLEFSGFGKQKNANDTERSSAHAQNYRSADFFGASEQKGNFQASRRKFSRMQQLTFIEIGVGSVSAFVETCRIDQIKNVFWLFH